MAAHRRHGGHARIRRGERPGTGALDGCCRLRAARVVACQTGPARASAPRYDPTGSARAPRSRSRSASPTATGRARAAAPGGPASARGARDRPARGQDVRAGAAAAQRPSGLPDGSARRTRPCAAGGPHRLPGHPRGSGGHGLPGPRPGEQPGTRDLRPRRNPAGREHDQRGRARTRQRAIRHEADGVGPGDPDADIRARRLVRLALADGRRGRSSPRAHAAAGAVLVPRSCPAGGFPFAASFAFADGSSASASATVACP